MCSDITSLKCGEIFCQSPEEFTIVCVFCEKAYQFEDFLKHFRDIHCADDLFEIEEDNVQSISDSDLKEETSIESEQEESSVEPADSISSEREDDTRFEFIWQEIGCSSNDNDLFLKEELEKDQHIDKELPIAYKCAHCNKCFNKRNFLRTHERNIHGIYIKPPRLGGYSCCKCFKCFQSIRLHDEHSNKEHGGVYCPDCDKKFSTSNGRDSHFLSHVSETNLICDFPDCGTRFNSWTCLRRHKLNHLPPEEKAKHICKKCGGKFFNTQTLILHERKHAAELLKPIRTYPCKVCGKEFSNSSLRCQHMAVHSSKKHTCEICGASFKRHNTLHHHKEIHNPVKKYKCPDCGEAFAQVQGYTRHKRLSKKAGKCIEHVRRKKKLIKN